MIYDELTQTLAARIGEKIPHLKTHTPQDVAENALKDVLNLAESSIALGGERVKSVMKRIDAKGTRDSETIRSFYSLLVADLELFQHALISLTRKASKGEEGRQGTP